MSDTLLDPLVIELAALENETEDDGIVFKQKKAISTPSENFGATPVEDRFGRPLWVKTRECFCPHNSETDCRFHSQKEPGWKTCPHTEAAKSDRSIKGRWLWSRNPMYGKPPTELELQQWAAEAAEREKVKAEKKAA
jgi:hypothetical protein